MLDLFQIYHLQKKSKLSFISSSPLLQLLSSLSLLLPSSPHPLLPSPPPLLLSSSPHLLLSTSCPLFLSPSHLSPRPPLLSYSPLLHLSSSLPLFLPISPPLLPYSSPRLFFTSSPSLLPFSPPFLCTSRPLFLSSSPPPLFYSSSPHLIAYSSPSLPSPLFSTSRPLFLPTSPPPLLRQFPWRNYSAADSAWVRLGPSRSAADAGGVRQIQFRRGTKNSAAESAADSADCCGTNLFRRGSDRIRGGLAELPPAECTEKGPRESATRIFRECPPRTFEKFRLLGTIPRLTTVPRNHSAANNRVAEPFHG